MLCIGLAGMVEDVRAACYLSLIWASIFFLYLATFCSKAGSRFLILKDSSLSASRPCPNSSKDYCLPSLLIWSISQSVICYWSFWSGLLFGLVFAFGKLFSSEEQSPSSICIYMIVEEIIVLYDWWPSRDRTINYHYNN